MMKKSAVRRTWLLAVVVSACCAGTADVSGLGTNIWQAPDLLGLPLGADRATLSTACRTLGYTQQPGQVFDARARRMVTDPDMVTVGVGKDELRVVALLKDNRLRLIEVNRDLTSESDALAWERLVFGTLQAFNNKPDAGLREYRGNGWAGEFTWSTIPPFPCRAAVWRTEEDLGR